MTSSRWFLRAVGPLALVLAIGTSGIGAQQAPADDLSIRARVVDADTGEPVSGVIVHASRQSAGSRSRYRGALSDRDGYVRFDDLATGRWQLDLRTPTLWSQGPFELELGPSSAAQVELPVRRLGVITGTVTDDRGRPLPDVRVLAATRGYLEMTPAERRETPFDTAPVGQPGSGWAVTDDRGVFELMLPAEGYVVGVPGSTVYPIQPGESLEPYQLGWIPARWSMTTLTDEAGRVKLPWRSPPLPRASASGAPLLFATTYYPGVLETGASTTVAVEAGARREAIDIRLVSRPARSLSGRVSPAPGPEPAEGRVTIHSTSGDDPDFTSVTISTTADGGFTFPLLAPGQYEVRAHIRTVRGDSYGEPASPPRAIATVDLSHGDIADLALRIPEPDAPPGLWRQVSHGRSAPVLLPIADRTSIVSGTVLDDAGQPVPGARVGLLREHVYRHLMRAVLTDDRGRFEMADVPHGVYGLIAAKAGYVRRRWDDIPSDAIVAVGTESSRSITVGLDRGGSIEGQVLFEDGTPATGTRVRAAEVREDQLAGRDQPEGVAEAVVDSQGRYRLVGVAPGRYRVEALVGNEIGWLPLRVGTTDRTIVLPTAWFPDATTRATAAVLSVDHGTALGSIDIRIPWLPVSTADIDIVSPSGLELEDVTVSCHASRDGDHPAVYAAAEDVDVDRRHVRCPDMTSGRHAVFVSASARPAGAAHFSFAEVLSGTVGVTTNGAPVRTSVSLDAAAQVSGHIDITGPDAGRASAAQVGVQLLPVARDDPRRLVSTNWTLGGDGTFTGRVVAGSYVVIDSGFRDLMLLTATLGDRDILDVGFEIRAGTDIDDLVLTYTSDVTSLAGSVVDANGRPVAGRHLALFPADRSYWTTQSRRYRHVVTSFDGTFRFERLPPGEYFVVTGPEARWGVLAEPAELETLVGGAARVTVGRTGETTMTLTVGRE